MQGVGKPLQPDHHRDVRPDPPADPGLDAVTSSALQAKAYLSRYGISEEQCARVSAKNHENARRNPLAQLPLNFTVKDFMASRMLAFPIKLLDASPISDGTAADILAGGERVEAVFEEKRRGPLLDIKHFRLVKE